MSRHVAVLGVVLVALAGCVQPQTRLQMAEDAEQQKDLAEVKTLADVTDVGNVAPVQVTGIGLVTGLDGTGHTPKGQFRTVLEQDLGKQKKYTDQLLRDQKLGGVKALLDSPNNALVLVTAVIPPGARRGDPIDVTVTLPDGSKTTSLVGGYLEECSLRTYEAAKNLNPEYEGSNKLLSGHVLARARGRLMVGLGNPGDPAELKRARIWQGGATLFSPPFTFIMKNDDRSLRVAAAVADRINFVFQDDHRKLTLTDRQKHYLVMDAAVQTLSHHEGGMGKGEMAKPANKELIYVRLPYAYRFNPRRYLMVARNMPLREDPGEPAQRYRARLQQMLLDPAQTVRAAVRLEALGKDSTDTLKLGLESPHPLVRFASAEALAYLGSTAGVDELARLAQQQPLFTNYALTALAGLDEAICRTKLGELLSSDDPGLRCAAFLALRLADDHDPRLGGEHVQEAFWLHRVAPGSTPLVYFAIDKRAEVVLFGDDITLLTPTRVLVGQDFTVTAERNDDRATVSRITAQGGVQRKQCSLRFDDVLRTLAELGGGYPDAVDLLRKLEDRRGVSCPVRTNLLPPEVTLDQLVELGRNLQPAADSTQQAAKR